jgi:hypothetical protein
MKKETSKKLVLKKHVVNTLDKEQLHLLQGGQGKLAFFSNMVNCGNSTRPQCDETK